MFVCVMFTFHFLFWIRSSYAARCIGARRKWEMGDGNFFLHLFFKLLEYYSLDSKWTNDDLIEKGIK